MGLSGGMTKVLDRIRVLDWNDRPTVEEEDP